MSEQPSPPPLGRGARADFSGGVYWFDGVLEGPTQNSESMRACLPRLAEVGLETDDFQFEAGRFSLLAADERRPITSSRGLNPEAIRQQIEQMLRLNSDPAACESTLRCSEVGRDRVRETLYAIQGAEIVLVARERALKADDVNRATKSGPAEVDPTLRFRRRFLLTAALSLAGLVLIWQSGVFSALLAPPVGDLTLDLGPFAGFIDLELDSPLLSYGATLRRGPNYPTTTADARAAKEEIDDLAVAKALTAVTEGERIYLLILDEKGETIGGVGISTRGLLESEKAELRTRVIARQGARTIRLALTPGNGHKGM